VFVCDDVGDIGDVGDVMDNNIDLVNFHGIGCGGFCIGIVVGCDVVDIVGGRGDVLFGRAQKWLVWFLGFVVLGKKRVNLDKIALDGEFIGI
jgi:hypothetical protein